MNLLPPKSWSTGTLAGLKKLLARNFTYSLSRILDRHKYETVHEGYLDIHFNPEEQPDVVIYDSSGKCSPLVAIEICIENDALKLVDAGSYLLDHHPLREFFLFDYLNDRWFRFTRFSDSYEETDFSDALGIRLSIDFPMLQIPSPAIGH